MSSAAASAEPQRVLVAVPSLSWQLSLQLASFLLELGAGRLVDPKRWSFEIALLPEVQPVHYARNMLVGAMLEGEHEWLWFLDDDITPSPSTVAVLGVEGDVITGRAPIVRPGEDGEPIVVHAAFDRREGETFGYAPMSDGPSPIVAAGAGCLLIRRTVLEDERMRLGGAYVSAFGDPRDLRDEPGAAPAVFRMPTKPNGEPLIGEDMDFVYRAHLLGYRCMFQPRALLGHQKRVDLSGVERMLAKARRSQERRDA